jgi:bacterioferritin-associated ferredoxin
LIRISKKELRTIRNCVIVRASDCRWTRTMIVCLCHRVSDRDISAAAQRGTTCFERLQDELNVSSSCGSCMDCAREVFDQACAAVAARSTTAAPAA